MKRMSEVFELPVDHKNLEVYGAGELQGVSYSAAEEHAAHAINNVDALADALSSAIPALQYNRSISDKADKLYLDAVAALNAYRGSK